MKIRVHPIYFIGLFLALSVYSDCYGQMSDTLKYKIDLQIGGQRKAGIVFRVSPEFSQAKA